MEKRLGLNYLLNRPKRELSNNVIQRKYMYMQPDVLLKTGRYGDPRDRWHTWTEWTHRAQSKHSSVHIFSSFSLPRKYMQSYYFNNFRVIKDKEASTVLMVIKE